MIPPYLLPIANCELPIWSSCRLPLNRHLAIGNRQCSISAVGQHRHHTIVIRLGDEHIDVKLAFSLSGLLRQYVPRMRVAPLDLSRCGQAHSLRSAFVCFQFWHYSTLSCCLDLCTWYLVLRTPAALLLENKAPSTKNKELNYAAWAPPPSRHPCVSLAQK